MTDVDLSGPAKLAVMSLEDHPRLNNAVAISAGSYGSEQVSTRDIERGLTELEEKGFAAQEVNGWRLIGDSE